MTPIRHGLSDPAIETLRVSEMRYRRLFETAQDGILLVGADSARIEDVNACLIQMLGYSREEFLGKVLWEVGPFADISQVRAIFADLQTKGYARYEDLLLRTKAGAQIEVELVANAYDCEGVKLIQYNFRDMAERKRAEIGRAQLLAQLRESQKIDAIGTLAVGIARELNNAVVTITGNVELARQDASDNPLALESMRQILIASARARALVQQLLFFSRRQPSERKPTPLAPMIEESMYLLRCTLPARLTLDVHYDANVPAVLADANQLEQVVIILVTNAMQAMQGRRGRIDVRLDTVTLDEALALTHPALHALYAKHPGRTVRLAVGNDGPDMDAATLGRNVEPILTTEDAGEGTGLCLPMLHDIVRRHEGAIIVDSRLGNGGNVTVYLPAESSFGFGAGESETGAMAATAMPDTRAGQHILYLDDDPSLVFLVERQLERRGYRISGYVDPQEALDVLRADPTGFDLVVSDYNMPDLSGLEVAREVHTIRADLPVVLVSGFVDEELRAQANEAGVQELILKGNAVENLCEEIVRLTRAAVETSKAS